jgi:hypothetical protein
MMELARPPHSDHGSVGFVAIEPGALSRRIGVALERDQRGCARRMCCREQCCWRERAVDREEDRFATS